MTATYVLLSVIIYCLGKSAFSRSETQ